MLTFEFLLRRHLFVNTSNSSETAAYQSYWVGYLNLSLGYLHEKFPNNGDTVIQDIQDQISTQQHM
jgi:hypothetical protein